MAMVGCLVEQSFCLMAGKRKNEREKKREREGEDKTKVP
jgi:hypothetical protein